MSDAMSRGRRARPINLWSSEEDHRKVPGQRALRSVPGLTALLALHQFLVDNALYPMVLSSLLAVSLLAGRFYRSGTVTYIFLVWNLFLAWIPYVGSLWAGRLHVQHRGRWWLLIVPGALWLAFFPNAPYILTDFWHLQERAPIPVWYDIGLLASFAWAGLALAVYSLRTMHRLVAHYAGRIVGWLFAAAVMGLGGLGIYLGRFLRWNSWDLVMNPTEVLADVAVRLADPLSHPRTFGVTLLFAAILFVSYLTLTARESSA